MSAELLSGHLQQVVTLDAARELYNVYQILLDNDCTESVELINQTLLLEMSTEETFNQILTLLNEGVDDALMQFGVYFEPEASLYVRAAAITALNQTLTNWSDTDAIKSVLLDTDIDSREQLAELLGMTTEYSVEEYLDVLTSVSDELLNKLNNVTPDDDPLPEPIDMTCITRSRLYYTRHSDRAGLFRQLVQEGLSLGKSFSEYLSVLDGYLEDASAQVRTDNLLVAALASTLPNEAIASSVIDALVLMELNIDELAKAKAVVNEYMRLPQQPAVRKKDGELTDEDDTDES